MQPQEDKQHQAIAREAAMQIGAKAHKNLPAVNAYYPDIAEQIILAAIEKACKSQADETRDCIAMVDGLAAQPQRSELTDEQIVADCLEQVGSGRMTIPNAIKRAVTKARQQPPNATQLAAERERKRVLALAVFEKEQQLLQVEEKLKQYESNNQIDMMNEDELRSELRSVVNQLLHAQAAIASIKSFMERAEKLGGIGMADEAKLMRMLRAIDLSALDKHDDQVRKSSDGYGIGYATAKAEYEAHLKQLVDELEWAWTIIANAGGGDWERESKDWQEAAAKWRDEAFHPALAKVKK